MRATDIEEWSVEQSTWAPFRKRQSGGWAAAGATSPMSIPETQSGAPETRSASMP